MKRCERPWLWRLVRRPAPVTRTPSQWLTLAGDTQACRIAAVGECSIYQAHPSMEAGWFFTASPGSTHYPRFPTMRMAVAAAQAAVEEAP